MKINKQILVAVLGLGIAVSAQAGDWLNLSPDTVSVTAGESGTTLFTYQNQVPNIFTVNSTPTITGVDPSFFSSFTVKSFTPGPASLFDVVVQWTVAAVPVGSPDDVTVTISATPTIGGGANANEGTDTKYVISAAPEPAQTVAGAMLLGCGGLVFAGRRLFSKKSA